MEEPTGVEISVIIVSYNTRDFLRACLRAILGDPSGPPLEIVVVDNQSADGSAACVETEFPQVKLLKNLTNVGYARAVNQAIKVSLGRYLLVLNPDVETTPGAIRTLWQFMESRPDVGIAGAKLLYPDGSLQMSCRTFYTLPTVLLRRTLLGRVFPNSPITRRHLMLDWDHNSEREVDWVLGACMIVRRQAYESLGGMDERFFLYLEDVDWCYRMKKHGWKVFYVSSAVMKHYHRRESARLLPDRKLLAHLLSTFRFYDKWNPAIYSVKRERRILSTLGTVVVDLALVNLAFVGAYYFRYAIRDFSDKPMYPLSVYRGLIVFVNVVCLFAFVYSGLYKRPRQARPARDLIEVSRALLFGSLVIMAATYLTRTIVYSRIIVLIFWPISALLVTLGRTIAAQIHLRLRMGLFDLKRFAVVGADTDAVALASRLVSLGPGYDFVGYIVPSGKEPRGAMRPLLGDSASTGGAVAEHRLNEVYVCDRELSRHDVGPIVIAARRAGAEVRVVSEVTDILIQGSRLEEIGGVPVVVFPPASLSGLRLATKYGSDYLFGLAALALLVLASPAVLAWQVLTHRSFRRLVAAYRNLGMVLAGRRSLVGPRGAVAGEGVKPGIIGPWFAASGLSSESKSDRLDIYYVQNWALSYDLEIMLESLGRLSDLFRRAQ